MRKRLVVSLSLALTACSMFVGGKEIDPTAGWSGLWDGQYSSDDGGAGYLEFEIAADTTGAAIGMARFDSGTGREEAALEALLLTPDSITTMLRFQDLVSEIAGARMADSAEGTYVLRPQGQKQVVGSGTWQVTRGMASR